MIRQLFKVHVLICLAAIHGGFILNASAQQKYWRMHTIDDSSKGADGVRVADANGDGLPDVCTGWEQGNEIRIYLHPGKGKVTSRWPNVTVGKVNSPEDAVFCDLDQDGAMDVVSCCEGKTKSVFVHWAPKDKKDFLNPDKWETEPFPSVQGKSCWMFCQPIQWDDANGLDLVIGSKHPEGQIGWLRSPPIPRNLKAWRYEKLKNVSWIMSIRETDIDHDGQREILFSDRKGSKSDRGIYMIERQEAAKSTVKFSIRKLVAFDQAEAMFLDLATNHSTSRSEMVVASRRGDLITLLNQKGDKEWSRLKIKNPFGIQFGKAVALGDLDGDGKLDLAFSSNTAAEKKLASGMAWISDYRQYAAPQAKQSAAKNWIPMIKPGYYKFDRIELLDLDSDGDLDLLTTEESAGMGVVWFENPAK